MDEPCIGKAVSDAIMLCSVCSHAYAADRIDGLAIVLLLDQALRQRLAQCVEVDRGVIEIGLIFQCQMWHDDPQDWLVAAVQGETGKIALIWPVPELPK